MLSISLSPPLPSLPSPSPALAMSLTPKTKKKKKRRLKPEEDNGKKQKVDIPNQQQELSELEQRLAEIEKSKEVMLKRIEREKVQLHEYEQLVTAKKLDIAILNKSLKNIEAKRVAAELKKNGCGASNGSGDGIANSFFSWMGGAWGG